MHEVVTKVLANRKRIMFNNTFSIIFPVLLFFHGIVHIIGTLIYWKIIQPTADISYKTTIVFGLINLGDIGIKLFGLLFLLAVIAYILASGLFIVSPEKYSIPFAVIVTIYSFIITVLDFTVAYAGVFTNLIIFVLIIFHTKFSKSNVSG